MKFQLEIQQVDRTCLFKLNWGKGQQISTLLPYPESLTQLYQDWRQAYLSFYRNALRARVRKPKNDGNLSLPQDRHRQLVQAEAELLTAFQGWLRREELYELRAKIASEGAGNKAIALFLTCSQELERLPWESWSLGAEFGKTVYIARSPRNISNDNHQSRPKNRKPRILAILGDDTGLDLTSDRHSLQTLEKMAEIAVVTWQPQQPATEIKQQIAQALTDEKGWEILFFAGHSNETTITGGEMALAPHLALSVGEIAEALKTAQKHGLQFALFNSCSGLSIANSLIDLGLSQVAIMREPVHNRVAQVFLLGFLQALASYQNVQQALIQARQSLQKQNLTYPSANLISSLYCHPDAQFYRLQPWGWQQQVKKWLPNRREAIAASALCLLSLMPPLQNFLIERRTLVQAIYRDVTGQLPTTPPSTTLIHIDEMSLRKAGIDHPVPMDRRYLASLIDRLTVAEAEIIGIDYLFDRVQPQNDAVLAQSIRDGVEQAQTWFLFGAYQQTNGQEIGVSPETNIGDPDWTLQAYTDGLPHYLSLLNSDCSQACPFAYLLAQVQQIKSQPNAPQPNLASKTNLRNSVAEYIQSDTLQLSTLTAVAQYFGQQWLRPLQDFSLPPDLVYHRLPAWQLLATPNLNLPSSIVIIGSGGYAEAGITVGADNFPTPQAIAYWQTRRGLNREEIPFTGSEFLAYMTHQFAHRHLVIPIPDLWAVLTVLLIAKAIKLNLQQSIPTKWLLLLLSSALLLYGLISLQLYIAAGILLPWLLPSMAIAPVCYGNK